MPTSLSVCLSELVNQLSMLDELLRLLPAVMIGNHEQQQGAELTEDMGRVRLKLEEMLATSEKEKVRTVTSQCDIIAVIRSQISVCSSPSAFERGSAASVSDRWRA